MFWQWSSFRGSDGAGGEGRWLPIDEAATLAEIAAAFATIGMAQASRASIGG
jgi:hypothetical protein